MKKIKEEINHLLEVLDSMKQSYDNHLNSEIIKFTNKINNVDLESELIKYFKKEDKSTSNEFSFQDMFGSTEDNLKEYTTIIKNKFQEDADVIDGEYIDEMVKLSLTSSTNELHEFQINFVKQYKKILNIAINLNKLLDKPIEKVKSIESIQHKVLLSVKDVELIYGFSKTQQQGFRGRMRNKLPHHKQSTKSKSANTKIYYKKDEIDNWIENFL